MAARWRAYLLPAIVGMLVVTTVTACAGRRGATVSTGTEVRAAGVSRADPGSVSTTALVDGIASFGHDLYVNVAAGEGSGLGAGKVDTGNVVVSPLSIAVALSMARAGAGGTTASEIDSALHFPADSRDAAMNSLTQDLKTRDTAPPVASPAASRTPGSPPADPILTVANGVFVQQGQPIGAPFLHTMAADYGAGLRTVDFGSAGTGESDTGKQSAVEQINAWVRAHTADRIDKLFDSLDPGTKLVLANAVYLKADWSTPFAEGATSDSSFTRADGSTVSAPTMHETTSLGYAAGTGWQAVELPYAGNTLAMWVILPSSSDTSLNALLTPATLSAVRSSLRPTAVKLSLPRWDFSTDLNLKPILQTLGIHAAFAPDADFSAISPGLFISQAVHRANITVDEWGTEAAAVTGLAFAAGALMPQTTLDVDHPFAFAIVHKATGTVIFEGSVADPTAR